MRTACAVMLAALLTLGMVGVRPASAVTNVSGTVATNTTWTLANSPYLVSGPVTVIPGVTLTIEAGTVVKFLSQSRLDINGTLNAAGTSVSRIYFTDYRDDSVGGDSNGDGGASSPAPSWWWGINIWDGGSAVMDYCSVRYSLGYSIYHVTTGGGVYKTGAGSLTLTNSVVSDTGGAGVWLSGMTATVNLANNTLENNGSYGLSLDNAGSSVTVTGNTISGNATGAVQLDPFSSWVKIDASNTLSKPITVTGGAITHDTAWAGGQVYYLPGPITVNAGFTLGIGAGAVVKFGQQSKLDINGTLNAAGTSGSRVYFTDYRDDSVGGDSNGDGSASSPAASWWWGINIWDGGSAVMDYCSVRYSLGYSIYHVTTGGGILKTGAGALTLTNSIVSDAGGIGVWLNSTSATVNLANNTLENNGSYGLSLDTTGSSVTVTGNTISGNATGAVSMDPFSSWVKIDASNTLSRPITVTGGAITHDTAWAGGQVYYLPGPITVNAGFTLGIGAGAVVKFGQQSKLDINGTLNAVGTSGSRVYFTDYRDDSVGGDSNGDGSASSPAPSWWWGINIWNGGTAVMDYCSVRYSLGYSIYNLTTGGGVLKTGAGALSLTNSIVSDAGGIGVWLTSTSATVNLANNTLQNNGSYGLSLDNTGSSVTVTGNTISGNTTGAVSMDPFSSWVKIDTSNTLSRPVTVSGGAITHDTAWAGGQVYYLSGPITVNAGITLGIGAGAVVKFGQQSRLDINGTLNAAGASGSLIYFTDIRDDSVGGDSNGDGSASSPAPSWWWGINIWDGGSAVLDYCSVRYSLGYSIYHVFTGGGILKTGAGALTLTNSVVSETGGTGVWLTGTTAAAFIANNTLEKNHDGLVLDTSPASSVVIRNNTIRDNANNGISCSGSSPAVTGNTITNNGSYGIIVQGTGTNPAIVRNTISANQTGIACVSGANPIIGGAPGQGNDLVGNAGLAVSNDTASVTVNARNNWWGTPAGPTLNGVNGVSLYVDYRGFLSDSYSKGLGAGLVSIWKGEGNALDSVGNNNGTFSGPVTYAAGRIGQAFMLATAQWVFTGNYYNCFPETGDYYGVWNPYYNPDPQYYKYAHVTPDKTTWRYHPADTYGCRSDWYEWWEWQDTGTKYIEYSTLPAQLFESGLPAFSLSFWLNPATLGSNGAAYLVGKSTPDSGQGFDVRLDAGRIQVVGVNGWGINITSDAVITTNSWQHIALSASDSEVQLYINGILKGSAPRSAISVSSNPFRIGFTTNFGGSQYSGLMDEIYVYNRALTAAEVRDLAGTVPDPFTFISQANMPISSVIQSNPVTVSGTVYPTAIAITGGEYAVSTDGGSTWGAWTGLPGMVNPGDQVKVRLTSSDSYSTATSATLTIGGVSSAFNVTTSSAGYPSAGLISWWRAEGNAFDAIGGNHGKPIGNVTYGVGAVGQGFILDGSSQYVQVASPANLPVGNAARTVALWFKTPQNLSSSAESALFQYGSASGGNMFSLITSGNAPGKLYFYGHGADLAGTTSIQPDTLYHAAVTYEGSTVILYLNGKQEAAAPLALNTVLDSSGITIGYRVGVAMGQGLLDEAMIFNRALSAPEIKALYDVNANTLTIAFAGTGSGTITATPPGTSGNTGWTMPLHVWDSVTLTAAPLLESVFDGWAGGGCSGTGNCSPVVSADMTVTATFTGVLPSTDFSGTPVSGVEPLVVAFTDLSGHGPLSWLWNFGDNSSGSSAQNPSHVFEDPGGFAVSLTAANNSGHFTATKNAYVNVTVCDKQPASILPVFYESLQAAYDAEGTGNTIRVRAKTLAGNLDFGKGKSVIISGGYDCPHTNVVGMTTLNGILTILNGTVSIENIIIK